MGNYLKKRFCLRLCYIIFLTIFLGAYLFSTSVYANNIENIDNKNREKIIIITKDKNKNTQATIYENILNSISIKFELTEYDKLNSIDLSTVKLLIVPSDTKNYLKDKDRNYIKDEVKKGLYIIIEKESELSEKFGIKGKDERTKIKTIIDENHRDIEIVLEEDLRVERFEGHFDKIFYKSKEKETPLMIGIDYYEGKILFLVIELDDINNFGYNRFLFFYEILNKYLDIEPKISRNNLSVYLDWGFVYDKNPNEIANNLKKAGINQVHISSWYCQEGCENFIKELIESCHSKNILVYMWLELPMISKTYWDENPNLRQKTATLDDAHIDWRYLMALEDEKCMDFVKNQIKTRINKFDFDGIDLAELYFESPGNGFDEPAKFTPMSDIVRKEFESLYEVDPIKIFDSKSKYYHKKNDDIKEKFIKYRIDLCKRLNEELILYIIEINNENKLELVITQIDSNVDSTMKEKIGVDIDEFVELQNEYDFTLQIEDPYTQWNLGHKRYQDIIKYYEGKIKNNNSIYMDINIVNRNGRIYPYNKQTGLEAISLVATASNLFDKVCLYEYNTVNKFDFDYLKYAMSNKVKYNKLEEEKYFFNSPYKFNFEIDTKNKDIYLNDKEWIYYSDKSITIPKGEHNISLKDNTIINDELRVIEINGEIDEMIINENELILKYNSKQNKYISLNRLPNNMLVNNEKFNIKSIYKNNNYTVFCPRGNNQILFKFDVEKINNKREIRISVDGKIHEIKGRYIMKNNQMLFEMNSLMNYLDAEYKFNKEYKTLSANLNDYYIWIEANNKKALANGKEINLDVAATIYNDKMMIPLRFVCYYLNYEIKWRENDRIIEIIKK